MFKSFAILFMVQFALSNAHTIQPRIINGVMSKTVDFPFFVHIDNPLLVCSGALISDRYAFSKSLNEYNSSSFSSDSIPHHSRMIRNHNGIFQINRCRWILTAGHCVEDAPINVKLGIRQNGTYEQTVRIRREDVHIYPLSFKINHLFDIGEYYKTKIKVFFVSIVRKCSEARFKLTN